MLAVMPDIGITVTASTPSAAGAPAAHREEVADGRMLALLDAFLTQRVMDGLST